MKFEIGDKVIPIEYSETAGFSYEKKICIGIPGKIEVINGNQYGVHGFYWPESALMLVEEKPDEVHPYIPFDLERALNDHPIQYRDGMQVYEWKHFPKAKIIVTIE